MKPPLVLVFVPFAAKCSAFWCEMQCVLVQNAVCFGAKYIALWCKMQGKMVLNAALIDMKCVTKSIIMHCNCINKTFMNHLKHGRKG